MRDQNFSEDEEEEMNRDDEEEEEEALTVEERRAIQQRSVQGISLPNNHNRTVTQLVCYCVRFQQIYNEPSNITAEIVQLHRRALTVLKNVNASIGFLASDQLIVVLEENWKFLFENIHKSGDAFAAYKKVMEFCNILLHDIKELTNDLKLQVSRNISWALNDGNYQISEDELESLVTEAWQDFVSGSYRWEDEISEIFNAMNINVAGPRPSGCRESPNIANMFNELSLSPSKPNRKILKVCREKLKRFFRTSPTIKEEEPQASQSGSLVQFLESRKKRKSTEEKFEERFGKRRRSDD